MVRPLALACALSLGSCAGGNVGGAAAPIIGGAPDPGHMSVGVMFGRDGSVCSGTLVSSKVVLTAAHCLNAGSGTTYVPRTVGFGGSLSESVPIAAAAAHILPGYDQVNAFEDDVGVIVLRDRAPHAPVPLHDGAPRVGDEVTLVGFGRQSPDSVDPFGSKMAVTKPIVDVTADGLRTGQSICNGDSGGPALTRATGVDEVIGIISYGDGCRTYGVAQRVDLHRAWIDAQIALHDPPSCERDFRCLDTCAGGDGDCPCLAGDGACSALCEDPASDPDCPAGCGAGDTCVRGPTCPAPDPDCGDPCGPEGHCLEACPSRDPDCPAPKPLGATCARSFECAAPASCVGTTCEALCDPARADACAGGAVCTRLSPEVAVCIDGGEGGGCSAGGGAGAAWIVLVLLAPLVRRRLALLAVLLCAIPAHAAPPAAARAAGDAAFAARRYREAARAYASAPDDLEARYRQGVALAAAGDLPAAVSAWESVLAIDPLHELARRNLDLARLRLPVPPAPDPALVARRARALLDEGRAASALALLGAVAPSVEILALRAEAELAAGDARAALASARALLALEPAADRPLRFLAAAHRLAGAAERARHYDDLVRARE
jgi:uncharacterized protein (TIGR03382 family)